MVCNSGGWLHDNHDHLPSLRILGINSIDNSALPIPEQRCSPFALSPPLPPKHETTLLFLFLSFLSLPIRAAEH